MHPILKIIYMLPFKTRRRILEDWLKAIGLTRHDQRWITGRMTSTEGKK